MALSTQQGTSVLRMRDLNRSAVLALIVRRGPIARVDIARHLGLAPATVTGLTRGLLKAGIIAKVDRAASRGGRPGELLAIVGSSAEALGVKLIADEVIGVRANLDGTLLEEFSAPFDASGANPFTVLTDILEPRIRGRSKGHPPLLGLGIGLPGFEDPAGSGIVQAPVLGWRHLPLGEHLARVLDLPVLIDNDVNTLAMAESLYGLGRELGSYLTVTLGRGIGLGIVINGELYRGARGAAGELGHVTVDANGELCACGKRGCLETLVAEPALVRKSRSIGMLGPEEGIAELLGLAAAGDERALSIYRCAGWALGLAVAGLAVVLNPEAILVSGEGRRGWPYLARAFTTAFEANVFPPLAGTVRVRIDDWDHTKWALGAAALVLRAPFATPMHGTPAIDQIRARLNIGFQVRQGEM